MTELEQIAASVARALGLELKDGSFVGMDGNGPVVLWGSGSNLFSTYWQVRCRDWLHKKGLFVTTWYGGGSVQDEDERLLFELSELSDAGNAEFAARAIHQLVTEGKL